MFQLNTWCNVQRGEVVAYPLRGILLVDVATATPSPGEHGDSATDLPSKRLTEANVLGSTNVVGSATLCSSFCGGYTLYPFAQWQRKRQAVEGDKR